MLNALIQLSTFIYGIVFNFLAPSVYGLDAYGEFIAQNAVVFLVYRAMALIIEPLIRFTEPRLLLANALTLNALVLMIFLIFNQFLPLGSPILLSGFLLNGSCLLCMQGMRLRRSYIAFLILMSITFSGLLLWSAAHGFPLKLVRVSEISIWLVGIGCVPYLFTQGAAIPRRRDLKVTLGQVLHQVPRLISITAAMNMLTSALPVFLAPVLTSHAMGLFKVMSSVTQSATIVFPVSTQAVLTSFVNHPRGVEFYRLLSSIAVFYFAAVCVGLVGCALILPTLMPYVGLAAVLPAFYQAILLERHLTATGQIKLLIILNWAVVAAIAIALCFVENLQHAMLIYAGGFALYAVALGIADRDFKPYPPLLAALALCPVFVGLMTGHAAYGIVYGLLVAAMAAMRHLPTRNDVRLLWNEL